MDYIIGIHYTGSLTADQREKGHAFVESLGLTVNGPDGAVYARKIITYEEMEDVSL